MGFELLLPVVLFILTLVIIFLLRSDDKRNQRRDLIRKRSQALLKTVEGSLTQFNESAQIVEERISKKIDESRLLMSHVDSQLTDLEARSEDLATLQKVLTTYQTSLTQLESTTAQVEQRAALMRGEVANLSRVQESLSDFDLRFVQFRQNLGKQIAEGEETMHLQHLKVKELQSASFAKLQEYEKEVQQAEQDNLAHIAIHTETLKNRQEASLNLVAVQTAKLRQLGEEGDQQLLAYGKALQASHVQATEKMQEQQREFSLLQVRHAEQQKSQEEGLLAIEERAIRHLTEEMQIFVRQCHSEMSKIFEMTLTKTDLSFQNMIRVVSEYLKVLSLRLEQARAASELLDASQLTSLSSFKEDLDALLQETLKGEQDLEKLKGLEEKAASELALLHQEADQLQASIATMKEQELARLEKSKAEEIPSSVVFAMALVDEACKPLSKDPDIQEEETPVVDDQIKVDEPAVEETLAEEPHQASPSVVFAMALAGEKEHRAVRKKRKPEPEQEQQDSDPEAEELAAVEKRQVEYLAESEEEVIILDQEDDPAR